MKTKDIVLSEMKIMGMVRGDDEMEWYSPNKEFKFIINRYENQLWMNDQGGKYIITIDIVNMIGVNITQLKFSEIDTMRILDSINTFLYEWDCGTGERMVIYINPDNLRMDGKIIDLERVRTNDVYAPNYNDEGHELFPDIKFQILQYSYTTGAMLPLITLFLNDDQLETLAFQLFFYTLIDIDIPQQFDDRLNVFVQNMEQYRNSYEEYVSEYIKITEE